MEWSVLIELPVGSDEGVHPLEDFLPSQSVGGDDDDLRVPVLSHALKGKDGQDEQDEKRHVSS
jgi:hypothetical protein